MDRPELLKGVSFDPRRRIKKFKAVIRIDGKLKSLGYFRTEVEAHAAFLKAQSKRDGHESLQN